MSDTVRRAPARVLVVAGDATLGATLREELEGGGFAVEPAVTGDEALRKVAAVPPDVLLLDLFPVGALDGLAVVSQLRQSAATRDLPIVVLGSVGEEEIVREALARGANAFFLKTRFSLPDLLRRLRALLRDRTPAGVPRSTRGS